MVQNEVETLRKILDQEEILKEAYNSSPIQLGNPRSWYRDFFEELNIPFWVKFYDLSMMYTNPAYEKLTGIPSVDYFSRLDSDVWDKEHADEYSNTDLEVIRTEKAIKRQELEYLVWKWPVLIDGILIAVPGIVSD